MKLPRLPHLPRPTYSSVMSTAAVIIALGTGTAYAAGLGPNSVKSKHIASKAVKARHIAASSVERGDLQANAVDSSRIADGSVTGADIAENTINSSRLTAGARALLLEAGKLAVNQTFSSFTVSNSSWPAGAPNSGAQMTATWTQAANSLDLVSATARVVYPSGCSATTSTPRGFDVKAVDADGRVISASTAERTDNVNYNGNGFWNQQTGLPGVPFRAPSGSALADSPAQFIDYVHLPIELAEFVAASSTQSRTVRIYFKRNSSSCSPEITNARIFVTRFSY